MPASAAVEVEQSEYRSVPFRPVKRIRGTATVLISVSLMVLTACSDAGTDSKAGSTPPAATGASSTAPSAAATSAPAAASGGSDAELCAKANAAGEAMKATVIEAAKAALAKQETPPAAEIKKAMEEFSSTLNAAAGTSDSKVATAVKQVAAQGAKAAAAKDPFAAADQAEFTKAYTELTTACKAAGVKITA